jgi:hypothetical protein
MTLERFLGEDHNAVAIHLEYTAASLEQLDCRSGKGFANLGRQTGSPRFVVSDDAVPDRDVHGDRCELATAT